MYNTTIFSTNDVNAYDLNSLHREIRENSKKIDKYLMELKAIEQRLTAEWKLRQQENKLDGCTIDTLYKAIA